MLIRIFLPALLVFLLVGYALPAAAAVLATRTPPGIPSTSTAKSELADLTVPAQGSQDGYDRDKFPHWIDQDEYVATSFREAV